MNILSQIWFKVQTTLFPFLDQEIGPLSENQRKLVAMFFLFEIATVIAGDLYRVDPFDQPGVEMGKRLTYEMMGRKGFERQSTVPKKPWRLRQE